jgi:hypothetical protein
MTFKFVQEHRDIILAFFKLEEIFIRMNLYFQYCHNLAAII